MGKGKVYVDGVERGTDSTASVVVAGSAPFSLGQRSDRQTRLHGSIDELRMAAVVMEAKTDFAPLTTSDQDS